MKTAKVETVAFWADCAYCGQPLENKTGSLLLQCTDYGLGITTIKCVKCQKENKIPQRILKGG